MGNVVPFLDAIRYGIFKKAFLGEEILRSRGVFVGRGNPRRDNSFIIATAWNHARPGIKKAAETVPVSWACRT